MLATCLDVSLQHAAAVAFHEVEQSENFQGEA